jgi:hypothetical protein
MHRSVRENIKDARGLAASCLVSPPRYKVNRDIVSWPINANTGPLFDVIYSRVNLFLPNKPCRNQWMSQATPTTSIIYRRRHLQIAAGVSNQIQLANPIIIV